MSEGKLVYSSESPGENLGKTKEIKELQEIIPAQIKPKIQMEKKGRGGKMVTVVMDLPHNPVYFKTLLKELKKYCGVGGTYKEDKIEMQGDRQTQVKAFLAKKGFLF